MPKLKKRIFKHNKILFFICSLSAVILLVSTYAWFIGMKTVYVSSFDVEIASTDSLLLSLDGKKWDYEVSITEDTVDEVSYEGHTNYWGGEGLFPVSSIGEMDSSSSRVKLYEKASLNTTPGGYRLLASRVHNYELGNFEQDGYVVFDLFVKNFSGTKYIKELNPLDEEAIFLTVDSEVAIATDGVEDTGIENSVRVAFTQVGRVAGTTTNAETITGITCLSDSNVTGICRDAQIWEPNDKDHVQNAINWYNTSCLARNGEDVTKRTSYGGKCNDVVNGNSYPTYAVSKDITSADNVDIYDGNAYNTYTGSSKIVPYNYLTDTEKLLKGTSRPTFMTLAGNSITKLRIYIYIEGQDIDNYDFASIGRKITVNFGFTKERFAEEDIEYDGPDLNNGDGPDITSPLIFLNGDSITTINVGDEYNDLGATATDNLDGDITNNIVIVNNVDNNTPGTYTVTYNVSDTAGNHAIEVVRTVNVIE